MSIFSRVHFVTIIGLFVLMLLVFGCKGESDDNDSIPGEEKTLTSINVTPANQDISSDSTHQFAAEGIYSDSATADLTNSVVWTSSNTLVATISNSGLATAVAKGSTTITATSGIISGSTLLTVTSTTPSTIVSLAVTPENLSVSSGTQQQFTAIKNYSDGTTEDLSTAVTWGSSNEAVAKISTTGLATAIAAGIATITATTENISGYTLLTVTTPDTPPTTSAMIIDHECRDLNTIPEEWILEAKANLHIAYGHTSHGSQLTTGMTGLVSFKGDLYAYNTGGTGGALDLRDTPFSGAYDLGNPDRSAWATATRSYLDAHSDVNVIIWSWCGQVSTATEEDIATYLNLMDDLEYDYPGVDFVYMTGHLDGTGLNGNLHQRNEQIRAFCRENNKTLYDFADIETYDPDGTYFGDKNPNDGCYYDSDSNGTLDGNWAIEWQSTHTLGVDWYDCYSAHSQPLNANLKAYAAWWLWARLAGWGG